MAVEYIWDFRLKPTQLSQMIIDHALQGMRANQINAQSNISLNI